MNPIEGKKMRSINLLSAITVAIAVSACSTSTPHPQETIQQRAFEMIRSGRLAPYNDAKNQIQQSAIFNAANSEMDAYWVKNGPSISGWVGKITSLDTDHGGDEVDVYITSENDNVFYEKDIPRGTPIYNQLSNLSEGEWISFSGRFSKDLIQIKGTSPYSEDSLTEEGSLEEPTYNVDISSIRSAAQ